MKLIYLWVEKFRSTEKQEFFFDKEFNVTYDNSRKLTIKRSENKLLNLGEKITNITALIGENGSGKTNILDLLGYRMNDRFNHANQMAEYFIIYHLAGNQFIVEGTDAQKLGVLNESAQRLSRLFSIVVELKEDSSLKFVRFLQDQEEHQLADFINIRQKFSKHWSGSSFSLERDPYYFFQRFAIDQNVRGIFDKYRFIRNAVKLMESRSPGNFFQLSPDIFITIKPSFNNEETELSLKYRERDYFNFIKILKPETMETKEKKEYFIHTFLERSIHSLCHELMENPEIDMNRVQTLIKKVSFRKDRPKKYLLDILEVLGQLWDPVIGDPIGFQHEFFYYYKQLYDVLSKIPENCFQKNLIIIKVYESENKHISAFLRHLDMVKSGYNPVSGLFNTSVEPLSSGEEAYLNLFTSIYYSITSVENVQNKTCILLLDEPDSFMHPEWSRVMISQIINYLEKTNIGYKEYQVVLTTHSPFIISDIPKQNLIALQKQENTGKSIRVKLDELPETFASNIHTLLSNEFFMNDTIGEFAKQKITLMISQLREIISGKNYEEVEKEQIEQWIEIIGEPIIKAKMVQLYKLAFNETSLQIREERARRLRIELNNLD